MTGPDETSKGSGALRLPPDSVIPDDKIIRYLLLPRHENDKSKFLALCGYTYANWRALRDDLRAAIAGRDALPAKRTPYGDVYELRASWAGPNGRRISAVTVWIRLNATGETRFVTMYPDKTEKETMR